MAQYAQNARNTSACTPGESLQEYARGIAGGLIFSLPLLYTMEMWWIGFTLHPLRLLVGLAASFALLLGYNFFVGIRHDTCFLEVAIDSIEELGIGLVLSTFILFLLGRITPDMALSEAVGKILIEAIVVAIGVSVGTAQLGNNGQSGSNDDSDSGTGPNDSNGYEGARVDGLRGQVVIAACGAFLFAANVAPTEEIIMLAVEMSPWQLLALAMFSIGLGALVLFCSNFKSAQTYSPGGDWASVIAGTFISYAVALVVSASVLWFFGRFDGAGLETTVAQTIVLGLAASLGASAGRLLLQTQ
jgi:putative integral membrane protein (TIGR02587 family)